MASKDSFFKMQLNMFMFSYNLASINSKVQRYVYFNNLDIGLGININNLLWISRS